MNAVRACLRAPLRPRRAVSAMTVVCVGLTLLVALAPRPAAALQRNESELITSIVTAALAKHAQLEVVSSADVQRMVALEGERQAMGCSSSTCLAEIAGAMGAELVVYGDLGELGSQVVLTLNLFDSTTGTAPGREVVVAASVDELTGQLTSTANALVKDVIASRADQKLRVVVLGLELRSAGAAAPPATSPAGSVSPAATDPAGGPSAGLITAIAGGVLTLTGAAGVGYGFVLDGDADETGTSAKEAADLYAQRDLAGGVGLTLAGVGVVAVGAGVLLMMVEE